MTIPAGALVTVDPEEERRKALAALQQPVTAASATAPPPGVALNSGSTPSGAPAPAPTAPSPTPNRPIPLTFAQMQAQGIARPAPPPPPAPAAPQASDIGSVLSRELASPGSFDSEAVKQSAAFLGQGIDDDFNLRRQELNEDLIRRGVSDSSVRAARTFDTNVAQKSAEEQLASQLLREQALSRDQALAQLLGIGVQRESSQGQLAIAGGRLGLDSKALELEAELGRGRLAGESEDRALQRLIEEGRLGENRRQFDLQIETQKNQFADSLGIDRERLDRDTFLALLQLLNGDSFGVTDNLLNPQGGLAPASLVPGGIGGTATAPVTPAGGGTGGTGGGFIPSGGVPFNGGELVNQADLARLDPRLQSLLV